MGIRYLNKLFREECKNKDAIKITHMSQLSGKKIAVDISIYLYKFASDEQLIENMYLLLSIFRYYNIIPIFVFDGKPPAEKKELCMQRLYEKKIAENEFANLKISLTDNSNIDEDEKLEILNKMDMLKKKFVYISRAQIEDIKHLIRSYGMTYCDAPGEADELCAILTIKGIVWGCLSEDMDLFVYGCNRVLRYLSLMNHTIVLYDNKEILKCLDMCQNELREICVISGTDYNCSKNQLNLYVTLKYFRKYQKEKNKKYGGDSFYEWLIENTNYLEKDDYDLLKKIYNMFDMNSILNGRCLNTINNYENIKIRNGQIIHKEIKEILEKDGFIFMH